MILSILKKIIIFLVVLFAIILFFLWSEPPEARKPMIQAFMAKFRPTVYLDCEVNVEEIKEIRVSTPFVLHNADEKKEGHYIYTDPQKIKKIMNYFCSMKLCRITKQEAIYNRTPDSYVGIYLKNGEEIDFISVYADEFVRDLQSETRTKSGDVDDVYIDDVYRSKKVGVIERINKLDF